MFTYSGMNDWYGLFVVTGDEDKVKERVKYRLPGDYKVVVPKRKLKLRKGGIWKVESKVLFPGYVLLNGEINSNIYYRLRNIPNALKLLRTGPSFTAIDSREMEVLSRLICNGEEIGFSKVFIENGRVRVIDGPLFSFEGIIQSIDHRKERAKVLLNFLGEERTVDLGISLLVPA